MRDRKVELGVIHSAAELTDLTRKLKSVEKDTEKLDTEVNGIRELFPAIAKRLDAAREELDKVEAEIRAKGEDEKLSMLQTLEETKGAIARHEEAIGNVRRQLGDVERTDNSRQQDEEQAQREIETISAAAQANRKSVEEAENAIKTRQKELKSSMTSWKI